MRRSIAGILLGVSLLAGSLAWSGFLALRTVLEPDRSREVAEELLDNDEVRAQLIEGLSAAINGAIPAEVPVSPEVVDGAAARALENPEVEALLLNAFTDTHAAFLGDGDAPEDLDLSAVGVAARQAIVDVSPQLDAVLPASPEFTIPLPTERIPDVSPLRDLLRRVVPILAIGGGLGALVALVTTTDRPGILRRAGMWAIGTTAFYLIVGLGIPWLLRRFAPDGGEVLAALATAVLRSTLLPSIVLGIAGGGLLMLSMVWGSAATPAPARARSERPARRSAPVAAAAPRSAPTPDPYPRRAPSAYPDVQRSAAGPARTAVQRPVTPPPAAPAPAATTPPPPAPVPRPASSPAAGPPSSPSRSVFADVEDDGLHVPSPEPVAPVPPRWVDGHGWVLDPRDPRPVPANARWVDGVGHIVPGPPPDRPAP